MYYLGTDIDEWPNPLNVFIQKCKLDVLLLTTDS